VLFYGHTTMRKRFRDYPEISLKPEELNGQIDFEKIFGRKGPVHIEIGSGKGAFLLRQARARPETNFLGIEQANKYYRYSVDRMGRWEIKNVRIIRTDAAFFLAQFVPAGAVDCFHIYFPDPWPKKRHHKRRFFNPDNIAQLLRCLKPAGWLKIATDHEEYFTQIKKLTASFGSRLKRAEFIPAAGAQDGELVGTNFERKYLKDKRAIYSLAVRKT